jgi:aminoglycoside phosphotransferase (APT) family kinase protein
VNDQTSRGLDVVRTAAEAAALQPEPLIILQPLARFMDAAGLGGGPICAAPIGAGHSNVTYAIDRGQDRFVLRRPPRGPLPASAHDVLREARLLSSLAKTDVPVPRVLGICEDPAIIGAPFYLMAFVDGFVLGDLPSHLAKPGSGIQIAGALVDALVDLHAVDISEPEIARLGRPSGYLERQIRRFDALRTEYQTRSIWQLDDVTDWLRQNMPETPETTIVHGDYRLGNVMFAPRAPLTVVALLDWEMATLGDPLADVGYLTAMWAEPDDQPDPLLDLSNTTRLPGFPGRKDLASQYASRTGRDLTNLRWYQTLAIWKAAIFLEGSYQRFQAGTTADEYFSTLGEGVLMLARRALLQAKAAG